MADASELKESWSAEIEVILRAGRGHLGVINYLRTQGLSADKAKEVSYDVFDEGLKRLRKSQQPHRIFGWFLVLLGVGVPVGMFAVGMGVVIISAAPILGGMFVLSKLKNPSRLPQQ